LLFLFLAIAFYALNALSCWYYLFYIAYFIAFHTLYIAIRDHAAPRGWQLLTPVACLVGVSVVLSPILVPMVRTAMGGASVYAEGADVYVADLFAYLAFPRSHILAPLADGIYRRVTGNQWEGNNQWEATVYLGVVNVVVLAWLCVTARHDESRLLTYLLCGIAVFCVFASGDSLHILGHRTIPMPAMALSQLPFFGNVRTPSRAIVFVYMFMAIGIAQAAALGWRSWQQPIARWGIAAVAALIILDFFPARRLPMMPVACPPGLAAIRDDSEKGFGVLDLPGGYHENNFYMMYQICHSRPIAQGITSRSNVVVSLRDRLESRDFQAQQRQLAAAKIKYIVIHHPSIFHPSTNRRMSFFHWRAVDGPKEQYLRAYPTVYDGPDLTLLKVY
jgi:hypothetical protein